MKLTHDELLTLEDALMRARWYYRDQAELAARRYGGEGETVSYWDVKLMDCERISNRVRDALIAIDSQKDWEA